MSEKQKYEAKRLVEILIAMGYIEEYLEAQPMEVVKCFMMKIRTIEGWIKVFTEAIGIYQSEELEKDLQKFYEADRKTEE